MLRVTDWDQLTPMLWLSFQQTVYMVFWTMLIAGLLGLVLGVALYTTRRGRPARRTRPPSRVLNVLVNIIRPIPFIIFITAVGPLTLLVMGTTIGTRSVMFPMSVDGHVRHRPDRRAEPGLGRPRRDRGRPRDGREPVPDHLERPGPGGTRAR